MRLAAWAFFAISATVALATGAAPTAPPAVLSLQQAQVMVQSSQPGWQDPPALAPPLPATGWREVTLPDHQAQSPGHLSSGVGDPGTARTDWRWYRLQVPPTLLTQHTPALYLPRVHLRGALAIYLAGQRVHPPARGNGFQHFNRPLLVALPSAPRTDAAVELLLRLEVPAGGFHALAAPQVGDYFELIHRQQAREWLQIDAPRVASACLLLLGLFALLVGLRRRQEPQHLWFFVLTLLFFLRCLHYHSALDTADGGGRGAWYAWMTVNSLAWITVAAVRMAAAFHHQRYPRAEALLWALALLATLLTLPLFGPTVLKLGPLVYPLHMLITLLAVALLARAARASRSGHSAALAAVLLLNLLLGVHDWLLRLAWLPVDGIYLLPYGGLAMFGVVMHAMARSYSGALQQAEQSAVVLDRRLAEREAELRDSHERLRHIEREQVLADERQRLMREMHDGLGSTLASTLVAVQRGQLPPDGVAQMLRESVDDLRLTLDSLDPAAGQEPLLLLATLRYRLAPRLEAAGITLDWRLHELPELPPLAPATALHLLRMLQEALANVVKHAQASRVTVASETTVDALVLVVADDGHGFDTTQPPAGRGLLNLRRRAESMGGRVELDSSAQGSTLRIVLPR